MKKLTNLFLFLGMAMLGCVLFGTAAAQEDQTGFILEELVVTAQKTKDVVSKTPLSITALTGDMLKNQGVVTLDDLQVFTPNLDIGDASHGPSITVRGVSSTDPTTKGEQGVVFSLDNIPIGRPQMMGLSFFDLERIEVLRGPQGTLYGKSATGGAINLITAKPKDKFDASASIEIGNFDTRRAEVMVNVPVTENLAMRAATSYNVSDGYLLPVLGNTMNLNTQRNIGGENDITTRISALYNFGNDSSLLLTGTFGHVGGTGDLGLGALLTRIDEYSGDDARKVFANPMAGEMDDDIMLLNGELNLHLGSTMLTYDGGHFEFNTDDIISPSTFDPLLAEGGPAYTWQHWVTDNAVDSHEIRLTNYEPDRLTWVVGANYWEEVIDEEDQNWKTYYACDPATDPSCNEPNPNIYGQTQHESHGLFGQGSYKLMDEWKLTLGARYSDDSMYREATIAAGGAPEGGWVGKDGGPCGPADGVCVNGTDDTGEQAASKVTWRAGLDYQPNDQHLFYGYVATGYKAGSFNDFDPATGHTASYGPEDLMAYEVGYKGRLRPNLELNASAYYYDYKEYQLTGATFITDALFAGAAPVVIYTDLVPATMSGLETELKWLVTDSDRIDLTATFADGEYGDGATVGFDFNHQVDWSGKRPDNMPDFTASASYEHIFSLSDGSIITSRIFSKYSSGYYMSNLAGTAGPDWFPFLPPMENNADAYLVPPAQYKQDAYTRTDINVGYTSPSGKFGIDVYGRNLEDNLLITGAPQNVQSTSGYTENLTTARISKPRTFGVRFSMKY